ncbi:hypothetical protein Tsp_13124 [Trichinella spiralis]|uniref:hypothetical protein n=1 Tax=Trichinella spiralis TaxID=6334 RepID=UPI0001EFDE9C|nr:hypothetical protein Tsp_13124 [Trichinella spiralis]
MKAFTSYNRICTRHGHCAEDFTKKPLISRITFCRKIPRLNNSEKQQNCGTLSSAFHILASQARIHQMELRLSEHSGFGGPSDNQTFSIFHNLLFSIRRGKVDILLIMRRYLPCEFCGTITVSRQLFTVNFKLAYAMPTFKLELSLVKWDHLLVDQVHVSVGTTCILLNQARYLTLFSSIFVKNSYSKYPCATQIS